MYDCSMTRVLSVDDHSVFRMGLIQLLAQDPRFTEANGVANVPEAHRWLAEHRTDIVLVDLALGLGSGFDLLQSLSQSQNGERAVVLTMFKSDLMKQRAFTLGAWDYLTKDEDPQAILDRVATVAAAEHRPTPAQDDPMSALSPRMLDVLRLLGQGLTTRDIAERLMVSPKTVETHRLRLKNTLGVAHVGALVALGARMFPATE